MLLVLLLHISLMSINIYDSHITISFSVAKKQILGLYCLYTMVSVSYTCRIIKINLIFSPVFFTLTCYLHVSCSFSIFMWHFPSKICVFLPASVCTYAWILLKVGYSLMAKNIQLTNNFDIDKIHIRKRLFSNLFWN